MSTLQQAHSARLKEKGLRISTIRNGGVGFLIGSVVLVCQWKKARKNDKSRNKFKSQWSAYLMKYPLFLASFTLIYKTLIKIGRQLGGHRGLNKKTGQRNFMRKLAVAISAFFCGYFAQLISPVFSWNWALYALLRSLLGISRLIIPSDLSPKPEDFYYLIHGILPWLITYNVTYIPLAYYNFFKACLDENASRYHYQYEHNHGILPNCGTLVHVFDKSSCLKSFLLDSMHRFRVCLLFYLKFYLLTSLVGGHVNFIKKLLFKKPKETITKLLTQSIRSCLFLFLSFQFPSRIHCLYKNILLFYHRSLKNNKFAVIACNQIWIMLSLSAIFGTLCLRFELSESKRSDIALFSIWRLMEQYIRKICKLETFDNDHYHPIIGNKQLPAILFGFACSLCVYVQLTDPKKLKSLERSIITFFLA